jgi:hypothetical protein
VGISAVAAFALLGEMVARARRVRGQRVGGGAGREGHMVSIRVDSGGMAGVWGAR